ncbi:crotonase/enoyl-CoA hydratase family protein [Pseudofrankia sp. BMG5.37]|uniref:crotonase/enoyl-CoA hydratase family protein n=1 Tax=Pseudofrankia sp. BMG5.37 TaxID=3050035 RepID=UPI002893D4E4|nr:crotonase/enoyl-CoA hydratase family protein [Pseudofrankia sp. BMG5.37]MDT3444543.1 crotonase/enoyl-CoA hydratase family protein [Pseudofrankia sp. BMG5.37]
MIGPSLVPDLAALPPSLRLDRTGDVAVLSLSRAKKRNALDDATVLGLGAFFAAPPGWARAAVLAADGSHFSAGLDLGELRERDTLDGLHHSRMWHHAFGQIESCPVAVICVLKGAVIGGGLELACATHIRVAERSAFFALPEGERGLFVGGGGSVRIQRLIGAARMTDMMLTGRVLSAADAERYGLAQYVVDDGAGLDTALGLAARVAQNSPVTTYAVLHALPRIAEAGPEAGLLLESLMSAVAQDSVEAKDRMRAFLDGTAAKVTNPQESNR